MSVNLSIKDVPDDVAARLRERAARNHRSMQRELMAIVESALAQPAQSSERAPSDDSAAFVQSGKPIEQTAAELRARWPRAHRGVPRAADIIRADRDSR